MARKQRVLPNSPFSPGWGGIPPTIAGRYEQEALLVRHCEQLQGGGRSRAVILVGPRGNGKTVLINWINKYADTLGVAAEWVTPTDIPSTEALAERIALESSKFLPPVSAVEVSGKAAALEPILGASAKGSAKVTFGDRAKAVVPQLVKLMIERANDSPYVLLVDEAHTLDLEVGRSLLNAAQQAKSHAPFLLVLAGTPDLESALNAMETTFWSRARVVGVGRLTAAETREAVEKPLNDNNIFLASDALWRNVVDETQGYPYFIQLIGDALWSVAREAPEKIQENRALSPIILDSEAVACALNRAFVEKRYYYARRRQELGRNGLLDSALTVAAHFKDRERVHRDVLLAVINPNGSDREVAEDTLDALQHLGYVWTAPESPEYCEPGIPSLMHYVEAQHQAIQEELKVHEVSSTQEPP